MLHTKFLGNWPTGSGEEDFKKFPYSIALATYVDRAIKKGQGHYRVMIYIYIVVLEPSMLHAKFL